MDSSKFLVSEKESDNARAFYSTRPKGNACNVSKASEKHEDGEKKEKGIFPKPLEKREKERERQKKEEDAKEILYCWKRVVNRKGVDRFIGVGLHKKSALCAV